MTSRICVLKIVTCHAKILIVQTTYQFKIKVVELIMFNTFCSKLVKGWDDYLKKYNFESRWYILLQNYIF